MKRLVFRIAMLFFLYLAAVNGTAVESTLAVFSAVIWASLPEKKYKIIFYRLRAKTAESPEAGWLKCQICAFLYRAKGEGRDSKIVEVRP